MDDRNPYAPSRATLTAGHSRPDGTTGGVWRDGAILVAALNAQLPDRCVKCNGSAAEPTKTRKVFWHHPAVYLLVLINVLIYAVVGVMVRKKVLVAAGLCAAHQKRRRVGLMVAWSGFAAGMAGLLVIATEAGNRSLDAVGVIAVVAMLPAILVGMRMARVVYARKIDKEYSWLKGCGPEFLDSLPQFPG
jgi:hypothetical protein